MQDNVFINFLVELFNRFFSKSPLFFKIIQWISGISTAITGLPALIDLVVTKLGYVVPPVVVSIENKSVLILSGIIWFMAKLPVQSALVKSSTPVSGPPLKQTDSSKLPLTAASEKKQANS